MECHPVKLLPGNEGQMLVRELDLAIANPDELPRSDVGGVGLWHNDQVGVRHPVPVDHVADPLGSVQR